MRVEEGFQQPQLVLPPAYTSDPALQALLERVLPHPIFKQVDEELRAFEQRLAGPIRKIGSLADSFPSSVEPFLEQYDQWGQRVDCLHTSEGWRTLKGVAAEEGLVSIAQERKEGEFSRLRSFAKAFLFMPDSLIVGCPISMTDGAARVIEVVGTEEMKREILPRLCSRNPAKAWTSGQWMTERPGGSDVSLTETVATPVDPNTPPLPGSAFLLNGFKWFSSATDGDIALALARTGGPGSKGLSLFLVRLRDEQGKTNGVFVHRLKKKWGTKALPTAELSLVNTVGHLLGPLNAGVRTISTVLNITRLHSAITSASALRRGLELAKSFAAVRHVGGDFDKLLKDNEMHTSVLAQSEMTQRALMHFSFGVARLLGRSEALESGGEGFSEAEKWRLRLLTPVLKSYCAELGTSELPRLMEALGGQGYMLENQFGRLIADAQVERIWEGTTSVLALDVVRVILQTKGNASSDFAAWAQTVLSTASDLPNFTPVIELLKARLTLLQSVSSILLAAPPSSSLTARLPRSLLFLIGHLSSTLYLLEQAVWSAVQKKPERETDEWVVKKWAQEGGGSEAAKALEGLLKSEEEALRTEGKREREAVYGGREKL